MASFYPLAYAAERIGGDHFKVSNLTTPGAEPHDLELSPRQVDQIDGAKVVLVLGKNFQPAVERSAKRNKHTVVVATQIRLAGNDPHVWLDPQMMENVVDAVALALGNAAPTQRDAFDRRASVLKAELTALDKRYNEGLVLPRCDSREIVTAHEAFGHLGARYGLTQRSIAGISPEAEPDPARLAELADLVKRDHVTTVFTETLVSPRIADTLAREAGVKTDVLDPIEGISTRDLKAGANYFTVMDSNLAKLRGALGCD